ncbi:hypothetical protein XENTR_v10016654 [Xenopus tropicalis]|uniref:Zinc finger protein 40 n=1 Tax=Xenopus tropicalis TaxID=8364 RepID=F6SGT9_XENTR|nr:zinc finger protein 40 [Xenopus tropicalis]XP_012820871.2 zinc finger protein 40 [Xenopus tropicalis]XP_012820872.2 zinc finger protein 40 [Xenopus tropicalis]KAE8597950.1 hypothetical protein XENTR_v10016654 [Xenopus tropicalis]
MPRTKQIHPKNLRDKIEEAQKKLISPEEPQTDTVDAGSRSCLEVVKGVKRKKIVTENHLKKIPKSPLRNVGKDKQKPEIETFLSPSCDPLQPGGYKDKQCLLDQLRKKDIKETKVGERLELTVKPVKSGASMQAKKLSVPPDLCNGRREDNDMDSKQTLSRQTISSNLGSTKSANINLEIKKCSTANSAFDVLLRAMEPELSNLNQSWPPCSTQTKKQGHTVAPETTTSNPSVSQSEFSARYVVYHHGDQSSQTSQSVKGSSNVQDQLGTEHEKCNSDTGLQNMHSSGFSSSLESTKNQQVYHVALNSSIADPSSSLTQVLSLQGNTSSPANNSNVSVNSPYSLAQVASLIGGEQMCNIVLKDQKPKKQGKYICEYCSRACAKPSVLLKHIRSHTGERPYPCVTCGFSFKTKSNLYKHKKSHAHAIKLGLGLRTDSGGMLLSHDSEKALCIHSDVDESGESDDEYISEERQEDQNVPERECIKRSNDFERVPQIKESNIPSNSQVSVSQNYLQGKGVEARLTELPKVVVYPVNASPLRADSPKVLESASEHYVAQIPELNTQKKNQNVLPVCSLTEMEQSSYKTCEFTEIDDKQVSSTTCHAQLQRQQATDYSQEQPKCLLSPRSLGSTDSGYFSRSESVDQAMSPPTPFLKLLPSSEKDFSKNLNSVTQINATVMPLVQQVYVEKPTVITGAMRPPLGTKTLEERISKLISDNEAVVDDKQLDSVKPRRTSLSRRGSIDSPKSYIFKDSFQFDLKPVGRRTSSSSDIPKSPFTPTDKSKQVFFLSVPSQFTSMDCLPITRSNSMPTTGYSAVPPVMPTSHPLRGSHSFDEKISSLCDDVFVSGPSTPQQVAHPRTLVRQAAVEDSSATEHFGLGPARSVDENYPGSKVSSEVLLPRSKSFVQGSSVDRIKKSHNGRGTMFECETCRNRYRKLENFENHKKFYCSELHGPKSKTVGREPEHSTTMNTSQPQIFHYRVAASTGTLEQPLQIRKRRKMKSVGDDDEPQQIDSNTAPENMDALKNSRSTKNSSTITILGSQSCSVSTVSPQIHLVARSTDPSTEIKTSTLDKNKNVVSQERVEVKCQGTGISVIQHTNSLSKPSSFEKIDSVERNSPAILHEPQKSLPLSMNAAVVSHEEKIACTIQNSPTRSIDIPRPDVYDSNRCVSTEKTVLVTQARLVRQYNIQVPEILVTEEPDKDPEVQTNEQETQEKFSWPQRSGSLSNLPTEKLPPKKKRIRLADLEHSSAESSFDSTISRSLSRESSLSRASSFSASFDKEEPLKSDGFAKTDGVTKSSEFLTIPTSLNTFGVPREMRRSASEQISCTQPSMEVIEYRSKSFDCGTMSRSRSMSPTNSVTSKFQSIILSSGHVPLLERRRGPLVKQISLSIGQESPVSIVKSKNLNHQPEKGILSQMHATEPSPNSKLSCAPPIQHSLCSSSLSSSHKSLLNEDFISGIRNSTAGEEKEKNMLSKETESKTFYAPKYQLKIQKSQESKISTPNIRTATEIIHEVHSSVSWSTISDIKGVVSNICTSQQSENTSAKSYGKFLNTKPVVVPVHNYSNSLYCGYSDLLPEILVTQDHGHRITSEANSVPVPNSKDCIIMPKCPDESSGPLRVAHNTYTYENSVQESARSAMPVSSLLTQQETSASSKRMLSPANSLDIAMEKHQKRVKDESGAAFNSSNQTNLTMKIGEFVKQRKPVLVRQLCTTDPGESLDQEPTHAPDNNRKLNSCLDIQLNVLNSARKSIYIFDKSDEVVEPEKNKLLESSCSAVSLPENCTVNTQAGALNSVYTCQERRSPLATKTVHIQGQVKLGAAISVVNAGDMHRLSFPSLKTSTSFTWCYLLKRKPIHLPQNDQKISAYASWSISFNNPNPMGLPTKVALSLLNSKQKSEKFTFTFVKTSHPKQDILVYSSKWKNSTRKLSHYKTSESQANHLKSSDPSTEQDKESFSNKNEPRRVKIFDGGYKSNEEYVYIRGRGRGKYICEECGIRCKKPSMLKKHIRTHTDVRPYHCTYCNFSFKTKGNLTKHMKSKAHSKKCLDMGVAVGPVDDQDTDDSGERQRYTGERTGFDADDSDGGDDDDNDDEDEDSQAESGLSATPSVTASPQHYPFRNSQQDASNVDEDLRVPHCFSQSNSMDSLPKALITRMTAMTTSTICRPESHEERSKVDFSQVTTGLASEASSPKSLCHQMSVDYPEADTESLGTTKSMRGHSESSSATTPSSPVDRSTQTMDSSTDAIDLKVNQHKSTASAQQASSMDPPHTHLFSHLPLHSQQPARSPYSMIPVGGIQLVPAGLAAYSTFVPLQAAPVQLTIPAMGVIHRTSTTVGDKAAEVPNTQNPIGVAEVNGVVPCIPIGQVNMSGLSTPGLQPLQPLNVETLSILGLSNTNVAPQIHPSGLTLNAVGLQVLTASPGTQSSPSPQTHIPGLQILNIALPTLIPSISPITVESQGVSDQSSSCSTAIGKGSATFTVADTKNMKQSESPKGSSGVQECHKISHELSVTEEKPSVCSLTADKGPKLKLCSNSSSSQTKISSSADLYIKANCDSASKPPNSHTLSLLRHQRRTEMISRQSTVPFSESSSDDDEDRLVIAT